MAVVGGVGRVEEVRRERGKRQRNRNRAVAGEERGCHHATPVWSSSIETLFAPRKGLRCPCLQTPGLLHDNLDPLRRPPPHFPSSPSPPSSSPIHSIPPPPPNSLRAHPASHPRPASPASAAAPPTGPQTRAPGSRGGPAPPPAARATWWAAGPRLKQNRAWPTHGHHR